MIKRLVILDQGLSQKAGHYFEYDMALIREAQKQGFGAQIFAHKNWNEPYDFIKPHFSVSVGSNGTGRDKAHKFLSKLPKILSHLLYQPARALYQLISGLRARPVNQFIQDIDRITLKNTDVILVPNASYGDALKLSQKAGHIWHILLRQLPQSPAEEKALIILINTRISHDVRFWTDTDQLTQWLTVKGLEVSTLPIPMYVPLDLNNIEQSKPYAFAMLGPARSEKNIQIMPDLIRAFEQELNDNKVAFVVQTTCVKGQIVEPIVDHAIQALVKLAQKFPNIRLIDQELSLEDFYEEIFQSSCLLIPYDRARYENRSSGLLVQAMLCGRPAIVPSNTWMAQQLPSDLSAYIFGDDLVRICKKVIQSTPDMSTIQQEWQTRHSAKACLDLLMNDR